MDFRNAYIEGMGWIGGENEYYLLVFSLALINYNNLTLGGGGAQLSYKDFVKKKLHGLRYVPGIPQKSLPFLTLLDPDPFHIGIAVFF